MSSPSQAQANNEVHLGSIPDPETLDALADFICGDHLERYPMYRTGNDLSRFFQSAGVTETHDGSTRKWWTLEVLQRLQAHQVEQVILRLVNLKTYRGDQVLLREAKDVMDGILAMENLRVGFDKSRPLLLPMESLDLNESLTEVPASPSSDADQFLKKSFSEDIDISELELNNDPLTRILQARVDEVSNGSMPLGSIFLLGSTLEGILLAVALNDQPSFMTCSSAPKLKGGTTVKRIHDWKLSELIDVSHALGLLSLDVKKFSHELRDFRNFIHPYEQMTKQFEPDQRTVDICWHVFIAAFAQLSARAA